MSRRTSLILCCACLLLSWAAASRSEDSASGQLRQSTIRSRSAERMRGEQSRTESGKAFEELDPTSARTSWQSGTRGSVHGRRLPGQAPIPGSPIMTDEFDEEAEPVRMIPDEEVRNVTPWQKVSNIIAKFLLIAGLLLAAAGVLHKIMTPWTQALAQALAYAAGAMGAVVVALAVVVMIKGQKLQGAMYTVSGTMVVKNSLDLAKEAGRTREGLKRLEALKRAEVEAKLSGASADGSPETGEALEGPPEPGAEGPPEPAGETPAETGTEGPPEPGAEGPPEPGAEGAQETGGESSPETVQGRSEPAEGPPEPSQTTQGRSGPAETPSEPGQTAEGPPEPARTAQGSSSEPGTPEPSATQNQTPEPSRQTAQGSESPEGPIAGRDKHYYSNEDELGTDARKIETAFKDDPDHKTGLGEIIEARGGEKYTCSVFKSAWGWISGNPCVESASIPSPQAQADAIANLEGIVGHPLTQQDLAYLDHFLNTRDTVNALTYPVYRTDGVGMRTGLVWMKQFWATALCGVSYGYSAAKSFDQTTGLDWGGAILGQDFNNPAASSPHPSNGCRGAWSAVYEEH